MGELKKLSVLHNLLSKKECRELSDDFRAELLENAEINAPTISMFMGIRIVYR